MKLNAIVLGLMALFAAGAVQAGNATKGRQLVETHCPRCHGSEVYTRPDRKVTNQDELEKQVQRCELALGLTWFDEDIKDAATYLNLEYYKFK